LVCDCAHGADNRICSLQGAREPGPAVELSVAEFVQALLSPEQFFPHKVE
jgi:hypothetical protein